MLATLALLQLVGSGLGQFGAHGFKDLEILIPSNLQGLVFDLEVYSKDDGKLLRKYIGVSYASGDIDINAHQIVVASGQFNALDVTGSGA